MFFFVEDYLFVLVFFFFSVLLELLLVALVYFASSTTPCPMSPTTSNFIEEYDFDVHAMTYLWIFFVVAF